MGRAITLCGFKSCGKTYFGKKLAHKLGVLFIDTDELIDSGDNLRELARFLGEKKFRDLESVAIKSIQISQDTVIATGGGVVLRKSNMDFLKNLGPIVYLECDKSLLKENVIKNGIPSFLDSKDIEGSFETMYSERKSLYENYSDFTVKVGNSPDHQIIYDLNTIFFMKM